ncbi:MAG TPA: YbaK/EbsC family protein [Candidatus Binatia bacterium]|nr:YbaK/EbsC family protein [Candidatus Binatia bacterium]
MPILKRLKEVLDNSKIPYEVYNHALAYTAQEIAAKQHFSGNEMAKVVMLEVDDELVMGVIAGNHKINPETVRASLGAGRVRMATEDEFISRFPECEIGAMPPFGNLFGLKVFVDPALAKDEYIYFNAGNHVQTVRLRYKDFTALVNPRIVALVNGHNKRAA